MPHHNLREIKCYGRITCISKWDNFTREQMQLKIFDDKMLSDVNEIKLHITLQWDDFVQHRKNIMLILLQSIDNGSIAEFKYINEDYKTLGGEGRYLLGDQFTIYFPSNEDTLLDLNKISELCKKLDEYCKNHLLTPGEMTKIESPITPYLSLRQDRVEGKYVSASIEDQQAIDDVKKLQERSEIYKFVSSKISESISIRVRV